MQRSSVNMDVYQGIRVTFKGNTSYSSPMRWSSSKSKITHLGKLSVYVELLPGALHYKNKTFPFYIDAQKLALTHAFPFEMKISPLFGYLCFNDTPRRFIHGV